MKRAILILVLLLVACFSLATCLQPRQAEREEGQRSGSVLKLMLGDGRRLFANHFFAKADAYFHKGKYPSIFDVRAPREEMHMAGEGEEHDDEEEHETELAKPSGQPDDWIQRFGRRFRPSEHVHLGGGGEEREILPWLKLSAELDPQKVETYVVAAYWLRTKLGKADEAEKFLREGLKANPNSPEILRELGRLRFETYHDIPRARNLWLAALKSWRKEEGPKVKPNMLLFLEIVGGLARLEQEDGNIDQAIHYLELLEQASPNSEAVHQLILKLQAREPQKSAPQ